MTDDAGAADPLRTFQRLVARLDYPMYVVTTVAADDGERSGCLAGFVIQCSIHPARHVVWVSEKNHTCRVVERADVLAVHALHRGNRDLARLFGSETGDEVDKFSECEWSEGPDRVPVVAGTAGWFAARIADRLPHTGDHVGYLVEPIAAWLPDDDDLRPDLGFQSVRDIDPGHDP
ncbi:MAG TPA: flavin reductase family protein [Acidimicrobiales bacterium]